MNLDSVEEFGKYDTGGVMESIKLLVEWKKVAKNNFIWYNIGLSARWHK